VTEELSKSYIFIDICIHNKFAMDEAFILQGIVKWSHDYEMQSVGDTQKVMASMANFIPPLHHHSGSIALSRAKLIIEGFENDEDLAIPLSAMKQIYIGFDYTFPKSSSRSLGFFWQPLRIEYYISSLETSFVYLIIDYNGIRSNNKLWFNTLIQILE